MTCRAFISDMPRDCHEAKFKYKIKHDGPQKVDFDGRGPLPPLLVNCIMTKYDHTGVTQIPHNSGKPNGPPGAGVPNKPNKNGRYPVKYTATPQQLKKLIWISGFCLQRVRYDCRVRPRCTSWRRAFVFRRAFLPDFRIPPWLSCAISGARS